MHAVVGVLLAASASIVSPSTRASRVVARAAATSNAVEVACNQARASHILVDTEGLVDTIREQVEGGMDFHEVASTVSLCSSRGRGGRLGWFSAGMMTPEFERACFDGEVGSLIKVNTNFGWHLIRLEDKRFQSFEIEPAELKQRIDAGECDGVQLVDVRNREELEKASIGGVEWINLPFNEYSEWGGKLVAGELLDKEKETIVICHHGMRSKRTSQFMLQNGFQHVQMLNGGIDAYAEHADPSVGRYENEMKGEECGSCG